MLKRSVFSRPMPLARRLAIWTFAGFVGAVGFAATSGLAAGEPAQDFLARLRAAGYYDTAIIFLDRLDQYPGVPGEMKNAVSLEKAQTYIDAAAASRSVATRDEFLQTATSELREFLKQGSHPRQSEARLLLGRLQMVRAAQLLSGEPDDAKRKSARESYLAAATTFDEIAETLREKLKSMQGAKIDAAKNPDQAALRDQYRGEFLKGLASSADARFEAAKTYADPGKQGKKELEKALEIYTDLSEKYEDFPPGAIAMLSRGLVQEELGKANEAIDSFIRMLEFQDFDPLRDAKIQATSGFIRLSLAEKPPRVQSAIDRGQGMLDSVRPNERRMATVLDLQLELAKAYLAKAKDKENLKPVEIKRAESNGRQLLTKTSKVPGTQADQAKSLLAEMGIEVESDEVAATLSTSEDPTSLEEAYGKSIDLYQAAETLAESIKSLGNGKADQAKRKDVSEQVAQTRSTAIQVLSRGLSMVNSKTETEVANSARQLLAFLLYQDERFRDASVVGRFLAQSAPGTEIGMKGGVIARNALQNLLVTDPTNKAMADQVRELAAFAIAAWPGNPETDLFQRLVVELALQDDDFDAAKTLVAKMPEGPSQAAMRRKVGLFLWQESYKQQTAGNEPEAQKFLADAKKELKSGLDGIPGKLADADAMKAALVLAKIHLKLGETDQAAKIMDSDKYGPTKLAEKFAGDDEVFASDLYSTELNILVGRMTAPNSDTDKLINRASDVMDKLRASVSGPDSEKRLTAIYLRMASDIREQLDTATPIQKTKLVQAFQVFLERIAKSTNDDATLQWIGATTMGLAESTMGPGDTRAVGQAATLLETTVATFESLKAKSKEAPLTVDFQLGRAQRLLGQYDSAVKTFKALLSTKENMLDAQMEIALAYEQWAGTPNFKYAELAYKWALNGTMANPTTKQNTVWGWGKISQRTSGRQEFKDKFFEARYHVALCRFLWGKKAGEKALIQKSVSDITTVSALFPTLGGPEQRQKFDALLKLIQKELGEKPEGLPPLQANTP